MTTFSITSRAGQPYTFTVCDPYGQWLEVAGVYMFLKPRIDGRWDSLYIGETENFRKRLPSHERWEEAKRRGATAIAATVTRSTSERLNLEVDLIRQYNPPMNDQHKGLRGLLG